MTDVFASWSPPCRGEILSLWTSYVVACIIYGSIIIIECHTIYPDWLNRRTIWTSLNNIIYSSSLCPDHLIKDCTNRSLIKCLAVSNFLLNNSQLLKGKSNWNPLFRCVITRSLLVHFIANQGSPSWFLLSFFYRNENRYNAIRTPKEDDAISSLKKRHFPSLTRPPLIAYYTLSKRSKDRQLPHIVLRGYQNNKARVPHFTFTFHKFIYNSYDDLSSPPRKEIRRWCGKDSLPKLSSD